MIDLLILYQRQGGRAINQRPGLYLGWSERTDEQTKRTKNEYNSSSAFVSSADITSETTIHFCILSEFVVSGTESVHD